MNNYSIFQRPLQPHCSRLAGNIDSTMNTIVMGAWALLLSRHSGQPDVLFGVVTSGRPPDLHGVESMIGLFVNTLPMRIRVPAKPVDRTWLEEDPAATTRDTEIRIQPARGSAAVERPFAGPIAI